jgi:hypothetical protein
VRKSAGDFIVDQFAGGEGVAAGDQQRRRGIGEGLVLSGWPAVHAWRASSAVSAGDVGVAATSAPIASGDGDTINAYLPPRRPRWDPRCGPRCSNAMACSADSGKPFNGMGVTRTSPAVLCGRQAATSSATCAPMLWPTTTTGRGDRRSSASNTTWCGRPPLQCDRASA